MKREKGRAEKRAERSTREDKTSMFSRGDIWRQPECGRTRSWRCLAGRQKTWRYGALAYLSLSPRRLDSQGHVPLENVRHTFILEARGKSLVAELGQSVADLSYVVAGNGDSRNRPIASRGSSFCFSASSRSSSFLESKDDWPGNSTEPPRAYLVNTLSSLGADHNCRGI